MNTEDPTPYPRDFKGYGGDPPDPRWPDGARVAVSIVLNVEAGSAISAMKASSTRSACPAERPICCHSVVPN